MNVKPWIELRNYPTSPGLQKTFFIAFAAMAVLTLAGGVLSSLSYFGLPGGGGWRFAGLNLVNTLLPFLLVVIAYALNPKKQPVLHRLFESFLITVLGYIFWNVVQAVTTWLQLTANLIPSPALGGISTEFFLVQLIAPAVTLVGYTGVLVYLRQSKRWQ